MCKKMGNCHEGPRHIPHDCIEELVTMIVFAKRLDNIVFRDQNDVKERLCNRHPLLIRAQIFEIVFAFFVA